MGLNWGELTREDNGRRAKVWADSTPKKPEEGEGPYVGLIVFTEKSEIPFLREAPNRIHSFSWWWQYELL